MQPVRTKADVIVRIQAQRTSLQALGVAGLGLFGSFVRDEATSVSDVDLLVDFAPGRKSLHSLVQLGDFLEALLGRRVELLTRPGLSSYIGPHILQSIENVLAPAA